MVDFGKLALVHGGLAFQLQVASMTVFGHDIVTVDIDGNRFYDSGNSVAGFTVLAFFLFLVAFILLLLINFGELSGNRPAQIATMILLFIAGRARAGVICGKERLHFILFQRIAALNLMVSADDKLTQIHLR